MAKKREERAQDLEGGALTHNPFAALSGGSGGSAPPEAPARDVEAQPDAKAQGGLLAGKLVVRRESKGRSGKTVTRVSGLAGEEAECVELARELKRALGVGAKLEAGDILAQGDLVERVARWLERRGAAQVVRGN